MSGAPSEAAVRAFLVEHYKHERLEGRGEDYVLAVVHGRLADLAKYGRDCISLHESRTGVAVFYDAALNELERG